MCPSNHTQQLFSQLYMTCIKDSRQNGYYPVKKPTWMWTEASELQQPKKHDPKDLEESNQRQPNTGFVMHTHKQPATYLAASLTANFYQKLSRTVMNE